MSYDKSKKYYVYVVFIKEPKTIFYVGKGSKYRYRDFTRDKENPKFMEYINNYDCDSEIIKDNLTEDDAFALEIETIALYRKKGEPLINILDGGKNPPSKKGIKFTEEHKNKIGNANKRVYTKHPEKRIERSKQFKEFLTTEKGKEFQEKSLRAKQTEEFRQKQSVRSRKANNTKEYIEKQSKIVKEMWKDESYRLSHTGKNNSASRKVGQYDIDGNLIQVFDTLAEASKTVGVQQSKITLVAQGKRKTTGGYVWKYLSDSKRKQPIKNNKNKPNTTNSKPIIQYTIDDVFVAEYKSIEEAIKKNGYSNRANIISALKGKTKTAYKYKWKYKQDNPVPSL